ncbi:hypothetical protein JOB18_027919 [Solea senegalensis]|uniref:Uncharacterized protein n=1 Tax=Solea senegalensis TaxID=28829 RepID=A0AAV6RBZ0_SOLSE|nr:hypothetical protein JOB18_027919 [Solea senegalensis]
MTSPYETFAFDIQCAVKSSGGPEGKRMQSDKRLKFPKTLSRLHRCYQIMEWNFTSTPQMWGTLTRRWRSLHWTDFSGSTAVSHPAFVVSPSCADHATLDEQERSHFIKDSSQDGVKKPGLLSNTDSSISIRATPTLRG